MEIYSSEFLPQIEIFKFIFWKKKTQLQVRRSKFKVWNSKNRIEKSSEYKETKLS